MLPKITATVAFAVAILAIGGGYSQMSALRLRQESQPFYLPHRGAYISGIRYNNRWHPNPNRIGYAGFRGGGIGAGK